MWESLDALSHQLELCKIGPETRVVMLVDDTTPNEHLQLLRAALTRSGADAVELRTLSSNVRETSELINDIGATADVLVTTSNVGADFELLQDQCLLHIIPTSSQVLPPHASLRRRVRALHHQFEHSATMHITDRHGTDLRVQLQASTIDFDHGLIGSEHRRANFPAGWVTATPARSTIDGELVVMPGDGVLEAARLVSSPIRLVLIDDHISEIEGDNPDADVMRAMLEYQNDRNAYGVAWLGIGLNPAHAELARPFDPRLLDRAISQLLAGVLTIRFGGNLVADRPGDPAMTVTLTGRSVTLDTVPVVVDGDLDGEFAPDVYEL